MESQYLQSVRYKLQKRIRRLNGADPNQFLYLMKQFWVFFDAYAILGAAAEQLMAKVPTYAAEVDHIFQGSMRIGENEAESAAIGYGVLKRFADSSDPFGFYKLAEFSNGKSSEVLNAFRDAYLEPFYQYVDECLDDRSFVLYSLLRYKRHCEWFRREALHQLWKSGTASGERRLAFDMYEYLHDRGVEFHIEPASASGEADMVALQSASSEPLIADAKIFNQDKGKSYLTRAVHQVYRYTCDYNEPVGYVVIFNVGDRPLRFAVKEASDPIPRIQLNHKTIFLLEIDVFPHPEPASKRKPAEAILITEEELIGGVLADAAPANG